MWRGVGGLPVLPRVFCFLGVSLSLVFASPSRLLCPPLFLVSQGRRVLDLGGKAHPGSARGAIYIGMLASHENLNDDQLYLIPNVLSASLDRYIGGSLDPTLWLQSPRSMPLHQLVALLHV